MRIKASFLQMKLFSNSNFYLGSILSLILISLNLMVMSGCNNSSTSERKKMILGLSADYPPFEYRDAGKIVGYDVDLAQALAQEMGFELVIQDLDFSSLIPSLESGRLDFVMSGMSATEERKKNISFSQPYYQSQFALILREETQFSPEKGFGQMKIGAQLGSTLEKYIRDENLSRSLDMKVMTLGRYALLIQELKNKRIDGVVAEVAQGHAFVKANPSLKWIKLSTASENTTRNDSGYSIAFSKKKISQEKKFTIERFNEALRKLEAEGMMQKLYTKWLEHSS